MRPLALVLALAVFTGCRTTQSGAQLRDDQAAAAAPTGTDEVVAKVQKLVAAYKSAVPEPARAAIRHEAFTLVNSLSTDQLEAVLTTLVQLAGAKIPQLANMAPADRAALIKQLADSVGSEAAHHEQFASWDTVKTQLQGILRDGGNQAGVGDEAFVQDLERLARTRFLAYDVGPATAACDPRQNPAALAAPGAPMTCVLRNGEASFAMRDYLVAHATKSIWIFSWAIYNDYTGKLYRDKLLARKHDDPSLDIRIIVDGATAARDTYKEVVNDLIAAGVQVIRWRRVDEYRGYGLHRKVMIVDAGTDHGAVIIGGQNFGDNYSRINPDSLPKDKWRDTDLLAKGASPVGQAAHVFGDAWNAFQTNPPAPASASADDQSSSPLLAIDAVPAEGTPQAGGDRVALINHEPTANLSEFPEGDGQKTVTYDPIYLVTLRGIEGARHTIDISNAYYIATAPIEDALLRAARRGIRIRLHTNSKDSVDEPDLIRPILRGLGVLIHACDGLAGCVTPEIYLREVSTVHSKYLVIDSAFGWIGSYNLHPRSYWYESEAVMAFAGPDLGAKVQAMFNRDITIQNDPETGLMEVKRASAADVDLSSSSATDLTDALEGFFLNLL